MSNATRRHAYRKPASSKHAAVYSKRFGDKESVNWCEFHTGMTTHFIHIYRKRTLDSRPQSHSLQRNVADRVIKGNGRRWGQEEMYVGLDDVGYACAIWFSQTR